MIPPSQETESAHDVHDLDPRLRVTDEGLVLKVRGGENDGQVVRLRGQKCSIGASPACTLRLVSNAFHPVHCLILRGRKGTVVRQWNRDTKLNGSDFLDEWLVPGDRLTVGELDLLVLSDQMHAREQAEDEPAVESQFLEAPALESPTLEEQPLALETDRESSDDLHDSVDGPGRAEIVPVAQPTQADRLNEVDALPECLASPRQLDETAAVIARLEELNDSLATAEQLRRDTRRQYRARVTQLAARLREANRQAEQLRDKAAHQEQQIASLVDAHRELENNLRDQITEARHQADALLTQADASTQREQVLESSQQSLRTELAAMETQHQLLLAQQADLESQRTQLMADLAAERETGSDKARQQIEQLRSEFQQSQEKLNQQLAELRVERDHLAEQNQQCLESAEQSQDTQVESERLRVDHERLETEVSVHEQRCADLEQRMKVLEAEKDFYLTESKQRAAELAEAVASTSLAFASPDPKANADDNETSASQLVAPEVGSSQPEDDTIWDVNSEPSQSTHNPPQSMESESLQPAATQAETPKPAQLLGSELANDPSHFDTEDSGESQIPSDDDEEEVSFRELDPTAPNDTASILARYAPNLYQDVDDSPEIEPMRETPPSVLDASRSRPPQATEQPSLSDDEDSIHDYMSALMQRMGGVSERPAPAPVEPPKPVRPQHTIEPSESVIRDDDRTEMVPRAKRPAMDLAAMRDVANATARQDISRHQFRVSFQDALVNWCLACCGFMIAIGLLYWSNRNWSLKAVEAFFAMCCGVYWTIKGFGCYSIFRSDDAAKKFEEASEDSYHG